MAVLGHGALLLCTLASATASQVPLADDEPVWQLAALLWREPARGADGGIFALTLVSILVVHELGHMAAARLWRVRHSWPYFMPAPTTFGTLGAFMRLHEPPPHRRALLHIAAAGPVAGLGTAMVAWLWALHGANVADAGATLCEGLEQSATSLLLWGIDAMFHLQPCAQALPPMAQAAWAGFLFTAFNLLPIGHLDGGHIVFALLGRRHLIVSAVGCLVLAALGIGTSLWPIFGGPARSAGLWTLVALGLGLGGLAHDGVVDEHAPLNSSDRRLAWACLALCLLTFIPVPVLHPCAKPALRPADMYVRPPADEPGLGPALQYRL